MGVVVVAVAVLMVVVVPGVIRQFISDLGLMADVKLVHLSLEYMSMCDTEKLIGSG